MKLDRDTIDWCIVQLQLSVIRYGHDKEPNPTLYRLIQLFKETGELTYTEEVHFKELQKYIYQK